MKPKRKILRTRVETNPQGTRLVIAELSCGHLTARSDKRRRREFTCTRLACGKCERGQ